MYHFLVIAYIFNWYCSLHVNLLFIDSLNALNSMQLVVLLLLLYYFFQIIVPKDLGLYVSFPDGRCEKVDALNTDTVSDLKSKIHGADGLPTYKQKLVVCLFIHY